MALDRIQIDGFKSIHHADLRLGPLNVLIGANGAGKSNLVAAFGLLHAMTEQRLQMSVAKAGGASTLLHHGPKQTSTLSFELQFGANAYRARLTHAPGDTLFYEREACSFHAAPHPRPYEEQLGSGHKETALLEEASRKPGKVAARVLQTLRSWRVYHFHDTSPAAPVKQKGKVDDNAALRADASNLAAFLHRLQATDPNAYRRIVGAVQLVAPFFDDFALRVDAVGGGTIQLEWREKASDAYFNAHALSDGTLRFICLATLLLQPEPPSLVLIDEPELGLHPFAITQLAGMLQSAATRTQVLAATQSVTLVNQLDPGDIVIADRVGGPSIFRRIEPEEVSSWSDEYGLGELWEKNVLGGRPAPAPRPSAS